MTEKDRYGETLRNREKAEEDLYAAEQDRLRLEKLRHQKAQAAQITNSLCPQCGGGLNPSRSFEIPMKRCGKCRGVWLSVDDLERLVERASEGDIGRFVRSLIG